MRRDPPAATNWKARYSWVWTEEEAGEGETRRKTRGEPGGRVRERAAETATSRTEGRRGQRRRERNQPRSGWKEEGMGRRRLPRGS